MSTTARVRSRRTRRPIALAIALCLLLHGPVSAEPPQIRWDPSSLVLVQRGGGYGRMIRLPGGEILCTYERRRVVRLRRSSDDGRTWGGEDGETTIATFDAGAAANPELLRLSNGWLLLSYNERPHRGSNAHYTIRTRVSRDQGHTWDPPALVYQADTAFENGCWEPAQIQLPSGEIQLFFANENSYRQSNEQEITVIRSLDNGQTWVRPQRASFHRGTRDGMPSPLLLKGDRQIVLAIEDNGLSGTFKPAIVCSAIQDDWSRPERWGALANPLPPEVYAGAPCLRQMPDGTTVLSVQCSQGRRSPHMVVYLGDAHAKNFAAASVPFDTPSGDAVMWNSLFAKDADTITAVGGTTLNGVRGIWAIDGKFHRP